LLGPSSELLDRQTAEEVDEVPSVSLKDLGRQALPLVGRGQDKHVDVTFPERLLVLVPGFHLLTPAPKVVDHLQDTAYEA